MAVFIRSGYMSLYIQSCVTYKLKEVAWFLFSKFTTPLSLVQNCGKFVS